MTRAWLTVLIAASCLLVSSTARADHVAGATYAGTHAAGGSFAFTVAADGTRLTSYSIRDVRGDTCQFVAGGVAGEWEGVAIVGEAFEYRLNETSLLFRGTFPGAGTAAGTLRLFNPAVPGVKPACDTGTVTWTASTGPTPTPTPAPGASPAAGTPGSATPKGTRARTFRTTVTLRRGAKTKLTGRISSPRIDCRSGRKVALKRGSRTIRETKSKADGTFSLKRSASTRGRKVRAIVSTRTRSAAICTAATSKAVRG